MSKQPLIQVSNLTKTFLSKKTPLHALNSINLSIERGQTFGLAGESGCGKSTLGKLILRLETPSEGSIKFDGIPITDLSMKLLRPIRRQMQMVFQDPYASLNPRMTIEEIIGEGLAIHGLASGNKRREKIISLLTEIGLEEAMLNRYPHEFSGGQRQRINIARALAIEPAFLVFDEPLSALDACTKLQVIKLFKRLKEEKQLTSLLISHDLNALHVLSDVIAIMYLGRIVEYAPTVRLFVSPKHPYTETLLTAIPNIDAAKDKLRSFSILKGDPPSPLSPPPGCPFHPRCPKATAICQQTRPPLQEAAKDHLVACHHAV